MEIAQIQAIQRNVGSKKTHFIAISAKLVFLEVNYLYRKNANKSCPQIRAATRIRAAVYLVNYDQNYVKSE